jgi:mono/diheme cytochrome c family protein
VSTEPEPPRRRLIRLILLPAALFAVVSTVTLVLALAHPAKPEAKADTTPVTLGDAGHGAELYDQQCAGCHGQGGTGGSAGPELAGQGISLAEARAQIEAGGGTMPAGLVTGSDLDDVLAYLDTILAPA